MGDNSFFAGKVLLIHPYYLYLYDRTYLTYQNNYRLFPKTSNQYQKLAHKNGSSKDTLFGKPPAETNVSVN
jgi:hypothetical protein